MGEILIAAAIFLPLPAAAAAYSVGRRNGGAGDAVALSSAALVFAMCLLLALRFPDAELRVADAGSLTLHFRIDGFRALFGCVAGLSWLVATIFTPDYYASFASFASYASFGRRLNSNRYRLFSLLTLGASLGAFFSADLRTTFLFFEAMSLTSWFLVARDETPESMRSAGTYLAAAVIAGLSILMGMLLLQQITGTLELARLREVCAGIEDRPQLYLPGALIAAGFGLKAGMFPLHFWLPGAYYTAPAPAAALLSGVLSKIGVFGVAAVSIGVFRYDEAWGAALLLTAAVTMLLGGALALLSNDLKRTLAFSSMSQIGFILAGVALQCLLKENGGFAERGAALHMLNHSLAKLLLFLAAGIVFMNRRELSLTYIRGFGRGKPLFAFVFLTAALNVIGLPPLSGYIGKTLLKEGIAEGIRLYHGQPLESLLTLFQSVFVFTGALTAAYMTKLCVVLFVEQGEATGINAESCRPLSNLKTPCLGRSSAVALAATAALLPLLGLFPVAAEAPIGTVRYFAWKNLSGSAVSVFIGAAVYLAVVRGLMIRRKEDGTPVYSGLWPEWLDLEDLVYRPVLKYLAAAGVLLARAAASLPDALVRLSLRTFLRVNRKPYVPGGFLSRHYRAFYPHSQPEDEPSAGLFSFDLLAVGAGICVTLIYVLSQALL